MKKPTLALKELLNFINDVLQKLSTQGGSGKQAMMPSSMAMNSAQAKWKPDSWTEERVSKIPQKLESENRLEIPTILFQRMSLGNTIKQITE